MLTGIGIRSSFYTIALVLQGIVISCCLICAVLFCSAAWDYILQYWTAFAPHVLPALDREPLHPGAEQVVNPVCMPNGTSHMEFNCRGLLLWGPTKQCPVITRACW